MLLLLSTERVRSVVIMFDVVALDTVNDHVQAVLAVLVVWGADWEFLGGVRGHQVSDVLVLDVIVNYLHIMHLD